MRRLLVGLLFVATSVCANPRGVIVQISIHSAALAKNVVGDPADQTVAVYLPPSYQSTAGRYPVVFLLHGLGGSAEMWAKDFKLQETLDGLIDAGSIRELIVVMPNASSRFISSYYANSPITGGWEDFIVSELLPKVDHDFRTIPSARSRAIAGWSMGGFGAIRIGMHRPDVFSVVYAISPCCLDAVEEIANSDHAAWNGVLEFKKYEDVDAALKAGQIWPVVLFGFLAAINPDPTAPLGVKIPVARKEGSRLELLVPLEPAYEEFRSKFPLQQVPAYRDNLSKLTAIGLEYGFDDEFAQVPVSTAAFSKALNDAHVPHTLETYFGGHDRRLRERLATKVFPYLSKNLESLSP